MFILKCNHKEYLTVEWIISSKIYLLSIHFLKSSMTQASFYAKFLNFHYDFIMPEFTLRTIWYRKTHTKCRTAVHFTTLQYIHISLLENEYKNNPLFPSSLFILNSEKIILLYWHIMLLNATTLKLNYQPFLFFLKVTFTISSLWSNTYFLPEGINDWLTAHRLNEVVKFNGLKDESLLKFKPKSKKSKADIIVSM